MFAAGPEVIARTLAGSKPFDGEERVQVDRGVERREAVVGHDDDVAARPPVAVDADRVDDALDGVVRGSGRRSRR